MKGRTDKTEMMEAPKSRKQPKDKLKNKMSGLGKPVMVGGAMRSKKMYGGGETMGSPEPLVVWALPLKAESSATCRR